MVLILVQVLHRGLVHLGAVLVLGLHQAETGSMSQEIYLEHGFN